MTTKTRSAFYISDRTGITAEMLGHSLLTQFEEVAFNEVTLPFVDTPRKADEAVDRINQSCLPDGSRPLVFSTLVNTKLSSIIKTADALYIDCFQAFIAPMETELKVKSNHSVGRSHSNRGSGYLKRMDAVNFALASDDGQSTKELEEADVILIGVSRCGKTPTCLYLGMQFGIKAANVPLIPEDFERLALPSALDAFRDKLFGLTIRPDRLVRIRNERRPNSEYASLRNCETEVRLAVALMKQSNVAFLDTTSRSIEELATVIMQKANLKRQAF
ncbi:MAG: posphoenolpyruvate synthetase regulatory kinase/phosphorylase PpsR [Burkholderiales bacterium]|jgi:regulator of PEP synthase PpsR (kinase-PPPase family)|tara:strand:+ start:11865 stop:12689 length:825 start_codon:yes stop_codon:yes gene_type:complete